ncbi:MULTISPECIES: 2-oxoacid:ferredoxin oxidoreductase subunit beta [unclassified Gemella]|uniref:2-oxoacid:ferredoxin oxidoreductase subunit beta n=1 Tax=unclassified Gemella TaxID=2624949 RepID=UPI001C043E87|nr:MULTISPECIES: 2-oxoacid:ferredoxin oxidoreductase subunit beta [unclassified Gemella]MBU0278297.1 2-oxoacid:ferredoxin oxidoreductase subunit beta [Gemella sp. zg-1178]QWQ38197.1 2-oxoacid:ferredoxin oxidoreductase subunit beta [Gemella sp. zg-570]
MVTLKNYRNDVKPDWCPGCGDFSVLAGINKAVVGLGIEPHNLVISAGIGCSGKISGYTRAYGVQGLHGRSLPVAQGIKLANKDLTVVAMGGDGDGYAIGLNHAIHAMRRNINITYVVMDNQLYALTKSQASPRSDLGFVTTTTLDGSLDTPISPMKIALSADVTFVAQAFTGNMKQLVNILEQAIAHEGFSLVNVFSPCHTYNYKNTPKWFKENLTELDSLENYDYTNKYEAYRILDEYNDLVTGIIYKNDNKKAFEQNLSENEGFKSISKQDISFDEKIFTILCDEFR